MTDDEFDKWLARHSAMFAGIREWFAKMTPVDRVATLEQWRRVLGRLSHGAADVASDKLFDLESVPRYERHPAHVKRLADPIDEANRTARTVRKFGRGTHGCKLCKDLGHVSICLVGRPLAKWIKHYGSRKAIEQTLAVRCTCERGESWCPGSARYDPAVHHLASSRLEMFRGDDDEWLQHREREVELAERSLIEQEAAK